MVLRVKNRSLVVEIGSEIAVGIQFVFNPERACLQKRTEPSWSHHHIRVQDPLELEQWFVIKGDEIQIGLMDLCDAQTVVDGTCRK